MQTRVPRPNSNHVTHKVIDRSFEKGRSCFTGLSFYGFLLPSTNIRHSFARRLRKRAARTFVRFKHLIHEFCRIASRSLFFLHRFRRPAMKLTVLHRDPSRDSSGNARRWNGSEYFARRAASIKLLSSPDITCSIYLTERNV